MPRAFDDASFAFYGNTLNDQPAQRERWKRGVALVNGALGEAVGQIQVARHYPPESDAKMAELIGDLRGALAERIKGNSWMGNVDAWCAAFGVKPGDKLYLAPAERVHIW